MPRDTQSLWVLRFRYDNLLHPVPLNDSIMDRILSIPPMHRVKVVDVSELGHDRVMQLTAKCGQASEPIVEELPEHDKEVNAEKVARHAEEA